MRLAIICALALTACGTRGATVGYALLAGVSGGLMISNDTSACDGDHSECDRVGPAVMHGLLLTSMVTFGVAALVSYAAESSAQPAPPPNR
jgi:hypothetical protein